MTRRRAHRRKSTLILVSYRFGSGWHALCSETISVTQENGRKCIQKQEGLSMCTEKRSSEAASGGCRGKCADLSQAQAPAAEVLKQQQVCHGTTVASDAAAPKTQE